MVAHVGELVWVAGAASGRRRTIRWHLGADGTEVLTVALFSMGSQTRFSQGCNRVPFESGGRGCNRAFGEVMPNRMKEKRHFLCSSRGMTLGE